MPKVTMCLSTLMFGFFFSLSANAAEKDHEPAIPVVACEAVQLTEVHLYKDCKHHHCSVRYQYKGDIKSIQDAAPEASEFIYGKIEKPEMSGCGEVVLARGKSKQAIRLPENCKIALTPSCVCSSQGCTVADKYESLGDPDPNGGAKPSVR